MGRLVGVADRIEKGRMIWSIILLLGGPVFFQLDRLFAGFMGWLLIWDREQLTLTVMRLCV